MEDPQERAKQLATTAAEEFVRCNGLPTDTPDQFIFTATTLPTSISGLHCTSEMGRAMRRFEHDEELVVLLGDYTMESLA